MLYSAAVSSPSDRACGSDSGGRARADAEQSRGVCAERTCNACRQQAPRWVLRKATRAVNNVKGGRPEPLSAAVGQLSHRSRRSEQKRGMGSWEQSRTKAQQARDARRGRG